MPTHIFPGECTDEVRFFVFPEGLLEYIERDIDAFLCELGGGGGGGAYQQIATRLLKDQAVAVLTPCTTCMVQPSQYTCTSIYTATPQSLAREQT